MPTWNKEYFEKEVSRLKDECNIRKAERYFFRERVKQVYKAKTRIEKDIETLQNRKYMQAYREILKANPEWYFVEDEDKEFILGLMEDVTIPEIAKKLELDVSTIAAVIALAKIA